MLRGLKPVRMISLSDCKRWMKNETIKRKANPVVNYEVFDNDDEIRYTRLLNGKSVDKK